MVWLVYGARGWIGGQVTALLTDQGIEWRAGRARCDDRAAVHEELLQYKAMDSPVERVLLFIGRTHGVIGDKKYPTIDYLEQEGRLVENIRDNYAAPRTVIEVCARHNIHCTYLGTGCIFTYDDCHGAPSNMSSVMAREAGGVTDDEPPSFTGSAYSTVKGRLDTDLEQYLPNTLVLRLRMPISDSPSKRNFITKIATYPRICSIQNSMSVLPSLLPLLVGMARSKKVGRYNFTNPGVISHNEILAMYRDKCDPAFVWSNWTEEEQRTQLAAGRSNTALDTTKLRETAFALGIELPRVDTAIARALDSYAQHTTGVRMLVTGGAGFIGSHFVNRVVAARAADRLVNVDALQECSDLSRVTEAVSNSSVYRFVHASTTNLQAMLQLMQEERITHVVHFAAQSHVTRSFEESLEYTRDNVLGTHVLLEAARQYGSLVKFVHVSTDEVYGDSPFGDDVDTFTEQSTLCPTNPYAATKASSELIARSYFASFGVPVVVTRGNNVYGPRQHEEKLIPRFISLSHAGKKLTIEGDGSCVRAFMHVEDAVAAFVAVVDRGELGQTYNIGCDEGCEHSVMDVARLVVGLVHGTHARLEDHVEYVPDRPYNDKRYYISNAKLRSLGWSPERLDFATGVSELVKAAQAMVGELC